MGNCLRAAPLCLGRRSSIGGEVCGGSSRDTVRRRYGGLGSMESMPGDRGAHQRHAKLDGEAGEGLCRRIEPSPASEKTARRGRWRELQLDSSRTETMSRTAVPMVVSARHGDVSIVGDGRRQCGLGFQFEQKIGTEEEETRAGVRPESFIRRGSTPRHAFGRGEAASDATSQARLRAVDHAGKRG
jgi:hypothetical protein